MMKFYSILVFFLICFIGYSLQSSKKNTLNPNDLSINPSEQYGEKWSNDDDLEDLLNLGLERIQKLEKDDFFYAIKKIFKYRLGYLVYEDNSAVYFVSPIHNMGSQPMLFIQSRNYIYDFENKENMHFYIEIYQPNEEPLIFQYEANCKDETLWVNHVIDGFWKVVGDMEFDETLKNMLCKIDHTINFKKAFCMMHREFEALKPIILGEDDAIEENTLTEMIDRRILDYDYCIKNFEIYPNDFE